MARAEPDFTITRAGYERVDELQPLWESLNAHHVEIAPRLRMLGALREPADSWAVRRELYEEVFENPDAFVLIAEIEGRPVGYAMVHTRVPEEAWVTTRVCELETLAVLPAHRGRGVGSALIARMSSELRAIGVTTFSVSVIEGNADAMRFYERLGIVPFMRSYIGPVPGAEADQSSAA